MSSQEETPSVTDPKPLPLPQPAGAEGPPVLWPAPDESFDAPEGVDLVPSPGWCYVQGLVNGIPICAGPNLGSRLLGRLNNGERLDAKWNAVAGARAEGCGGSSTWWIPVAWRGVWAYVPKLCVYYGQPTAAVAPELASAAPAATAGADVHFIDWHAQHDHMSGALRVYGTCTLPGGGFALLLEESTDPPGFNPEMLLLDLQVMPTGESPATQAVEWSRPWVDGTRYTEVHIRCVGPVSTPEGPVLKVEDVY